MKKGSLSLSVNAIVVLILAITMLGLGLGFMKGMFGKVTSQVEDVISITDLQYKPTAEDPFTLSFRDTTITKGSSKRLDLGYLNTDGTQWTDITPELDCTAPSGAQALPNIPDYRVGSAKTVPAGQAEVFSVMVTTTADTETGTHLCTVNLVESGGSSVANEDVFINIR